MSQPIRPAPFTTKAEVDAYFAQDPLPCLICGKPFVRLSHHVPRMHAMQADEYRATFGIPWGRGLISESLRLKQAGIMNEQRAAGILPRSPSPEHIARIQILAKHRRPTAACVKDALSLHGLEMHGRSERLALADFEEFLRRIATGRTITEVGHDPDMMARETFDTYCRRNPEFNARVEKVLDDLPPAVQVRGQRVGKSLTTLITIMRDEHAMTWPEIADVLGMKTSTIGGIYRRGKLANAAEPV